MPRLAGADTRAPLRSAIAISALVAIAVTGPMSLPSMARESSRTVAARAATPASGPLLTVVSLRKQKLRVFDLNGEITSTRISSGKPGFDTPTGVFSLLEKNVHHESNIYAGAEMPFMQRLTWSGIALHAGQVPGYRASHGCIRLPYSFAKSLFGITKLGGRVVVTQDETQPIEFSHPKLFKPLPATQPASAPAMAQAATRVASNDIAIGATSLDRMSELPRLFGITPALAEAVKSYQPQQDKPRTRVEADRAMREKLSRAETELKVIESQRKTATEAAKVAVQTAAGANGKLVALKKDAERVRAALKSAETKLAIADKAFEAFLSAHPQRSALPPDGSVDDQEADLEDQLLAAASDVDSARVDVARNELALAEMQATAVTGETARARAIATVQKAMTDLKSAQLSLVEIKKEMLRRNKPIAVLISLKSSRIYVRQGFEPVLEAPIQVIQPIDRIGTHVMTAMRYAIDNPDTFEWRLITAQMPPLRRTDETDRTSKKARQKDANAPQVVTSFASAVAEEALDSVVIPPDIADIISERATPGSSLIITDRDLKANENGLNTEFVLLTR